MALVEQLFATGLLLVCRSVLKAKCLVLSFEHRLGQNTLLEPKRSYMLQMPEYFFQNYVVCQFSANIWPSRPSNAGYGNEGYGGSVVLAWHGISLVSGWTWPKILDYVS